MIRPGYLQLIATLMSDKQKHRVVRLPATTCDKAMEKEQLLLEQVKQGTFNQALLLWRCTAPAIVLPAGRKWQKTEPLSEWLAQRGWDILQRRSGGSPVPQSPAMLNIAHMYTLTATQSYSVKGAYQQLCDNLLAFFAALDISADIHATEYAYCDGDYNLNINGQKIVGTAQRVLTAPGGRRIVLAHACLLIDDVLESIIPPVNACNEFNNIPDRVKLNAHTCLNRHLADSLTTDELFSGLIRAFSRHTVFS